MRSGWVGFWGVLVAWCEVVDGGGRTGWKEGGGFVEFVDQRFQFYGKTRREFSEKILPAAVAKSSKDLFPRVRQPAIHQNRPAHMETHHVQSSPS